MLCELVVLSLATLAFSGHVTCNMDLFTEARYRYPIMRYIPVNFQELSHQISAERPLLILIRTAEATHNNNEDYEIYWRAMKVPINNNQICQWSRDERLRYFDPELKPTVAAKQINDLRLLLEITGWRQFLESVDAVQYLCSPLSRSIQMALHTFPHAKITVDEGVKERITPFGPDLRRNFESRLNIGDRSVESIQDKFQPYADRLVFQMAKPESRLIYNRFGYYSDEDPSIELSRMETDEELDARIRAWLEMLCPDPYRHSNITKLIDQWLPNHITVRHHPKVYVVFANSQFITGVCKHFNLDAYQGQGDRPGFCEFIPIWLQFHTEQDLQYDEPDCSCSQTNVE